MLLVSDWKHSVNGLATGDSTLEFRCQGCGRWYVRRPPLSLWIAGAILTVVACGLGLPFLYLAWRSQSFDARLPVVPGAPVPPMNFPGGPPPRSCRGCQRPAVAVKITRSKTNGIPTGTEFEYRCTSCRREFTIESVLGHLTSTLSGLAVAGVAAAFFTIAQSAGWRYGGGVVAAAAALLMLTQTVRRLLHRLQNPVFQPLQGA